MYEVMGSDMISKSSKAWEERLIEACEDGDLVKDIVREITIFRKESYTTPYECEGCYFHDHSDGSTCMK